MIYSSLLGLLSNRLFNCMVADGNVCPNVGVIFKDLMLSTCFHGSTWLSLFSCLSKSKENFRITYRFNHVELMNTECAVLQLIFIGFQLHDQSSQLDYLSQKNWWITEYGPYYHGFSSYKTWMCLLSLITEEHTIMDYHQRSLKF